MPSYFFTIFAVLVAVGPGLAAGNDGTDQTCEGAMKPALTGWPGNNFWGDLEETPDPTREETGGNGGPLFLLAPSKEKTNVHKAITRMCATMCSLMYDANARGEADDDKLGETLFYDSIKMQAKHHEFPALVFDDKLKIFDDHGLIKSALAPMATAIVNDTMIIAWRGSSTLMDWASNVGGAPIRPSAFAKRAPGLRVHAGYYALIDNEMTTNGKTIQEHIAKSNVKEVVFTGHSLGGGLAQVAHLFALAQWAEHHPDVTFRTLTFSAPMTFFRSDDEMDKEDMATLDELDKVLAKDTRNIVFCGDIVPRLAGNTKYAETVFKYIWKESKENIWHNLGNFFLRLHRDKKAEALQTTLFSDGNYTGVLTFLGKYEHRSQLIYYEETEVTEDDSVYKYTCSKKNAAEFAGIELKDAHDNIEANSQKFHNPKSKSRKKTFESLMEYLEDVHTVLPYAMSPIYSTRFARIN